MITAPRKIIRKLSCELFTTTCIIAVALALACTAIAQREPLRIDKPIDTFGMRPEERVDLGNGKFKKVYRNEAGHVVREEIFETTGTMVRVEQRVEIRQTETVYEDGRPARVRVITYGDEPNSGTRIPKTSDAVTYGPGGDVVERIRYIFDCDGYLIRGTRIVTNWVGRREPIMRIQHYDEATKSWGDLPGQPEPFKPRPAPISSNTTPNQAAATANAFARVRANGEDSLLISLTAPQKFDSLQITLPNSRTFSAATATAFARVRANGEDSLLISLTAPQKFDSLQITLPNSRTFSAGSLPQDWTMKQDGKRIAFTGAGTDTINIRLDSPAGGDPLSGKAIEIESALARKRIFETRVTANSLPPVTNVGDLASALTLPPEVTIGQPFLATPQGGFTDGTWRISNGPAGQWIDTGDPNYRPVLFKIAENETPTPKDRSYYRFQYFDKWNEMLRNGEAQIQALAPSANNTLGPNMAGDRFAISGQSTCSRRNSSLWEDWFFSTLDKRIPLRPLAASPTTMILSIPANTAPGQHTIGYACPATALYTINVLGVEGSIDTNKLWRGESTTMRLRVVGTDEALPISITNGTPSIIDLEGGLKYTVKSSGGAENVITRSVRGIQRGNFQINYQLDYPICGGGKPGAP